MTRQSLMALAFTLALAAPAWADSNRPAEIQSIAQTRENLARAQQGAGKPGPALAIQQQRQEVQKLLDKLEAGQQVDPAEVERVLRQSQHLY